MTDKILKDATARMEKCVASLVSELARIRTGRAHPSLLEPIKVMVYGTQTPLSQIANVSAEDAQTLSIQPWDKSHIVPIEKAIMTANLGLNPVTAGLVIRVPMPPLTQERRVSLTKVVRDSGESSKISIRSIRRDANASIKLLLKDKEISEDEDRKAVADIQKLTDSYVKKMDAMTATKEKDLLTV